MVQLGRHQAAVDELNIAIGLDDHRPAAWLHRGQAHFGLQDWTRAESDCTRALELAPGSAVAWETRGRARYHLGWFDAASADLAQAIARRRPIHPDTTGAVWRNEMAAIRKRRWPISPPPSS